MALLYDSCSQRRKSRRFKHNIRNRQLSEQQQQEANRKTDDKLR